MRIPVEEGEAIGKVGGQTLDVGVVNRRVTLRGFVFPEHCDGGCDYWTGHLAFAYDHLDPTQVRVSLGDFGGRTAQFGVAGNGPDPRDVGVETGPVTYELVQWQYQAFPGKTAAEVSGFTGAARLYVR